MGIVRGKYEESYEESYGANASAESSYDIGITSRHIRSTCVCVPIQYMSNICPGYKVYLYMCSKDTSSKDTSSKDTLPILVYVCLYNICPIYVLDMSTLYDQLLQCNAQCSIILQYRY
jgi:hypothetical protein